MGGAGASPLLSSGREWLEGEEETLLAAEGEGEEDRFRTCRTRIRIRSHACGVQHLKNDDIDIIQKPENKLFFKF